MNNSNSCELHINYNPCRNTNNIEQQTTPCTLFSIYFFISTNIVVTCLIWQNCQKQPWELGGGRITWMICLQTHWVYFPARRPRPRPRENVRFLSFKQIGRWVKEAGGGKEDLLKWTPHISRWDLPKLVDNICSTFSLYSQVGCVNIFAFYPRKRLNIQCRANNQFVETGNKASVPNTTR